MCSGTGGTLPQTENEQEVQPMKKVRQVFLLLAALGLLTAFSCGRAGAKDVSGTILDGFSWRFNANTGTLTIEGKGAMPDAANRYPAGDYWSAYQDAIRHIVYADGLTDVRRVESGLPVEADGRDWQYTTGFYQLPNLETVTAENDKGFSWELDFTPSTLTIGPGKDKTALLPLEITAAHLVLADGVASPPSLPAGKRWESITLGKSVWAVDEGWQSDWYTVDGRNGHFAAWEGSLYSKDFSVLYKSCETGGTIYGPETLREIASFAFSGSADEPATVVLPDGLTTLQSDALSGFNWNTTFVFPDSLTEIGENILMLPRECNCTLIYSRDNEALRNVQLGGFGITAERQEVDSVEEYYAAEDLSGQNS